MRPNRIAAFAVVLLGAALAAQNQNLFEIYPASSCTNFTTRGGLDGAAGELLLQVPYLQQAGVGMDTSGRASRLLGFRFVTQDQNAATPSTYSVVLRADRGGAPDCTSAGLRALLGPYQLPSGTGIIAWIITQNFATPFVDPRLTCDSFYLGVELAASPTWTGDGQSVHMSSYFLLNGTRGGGAAPSAPNLAWSCIAGMPALSPVFSTYRIGALVDAATLAMGNEDPTWTNSCVTPPIDFGAGGFWPQAQGPIGARNDGLHARVRDQANAGGLFAVALDYQFTCPGVPLAGMQGAWMLSPAAALVASGQLNSAGEGQAQLFPPGFIAPYARLVTTRMFFTQAVTGGTAGIKLSNRAGVMYRP